VILDGSGLPTTASSWPIFNSCSKIEQEVRKDDENQQTSVFFENITHV
jgi:hypothetical protein